MSINVFDLAKGALGSGALGKLSESLGENEKKTSSAMDLAGSAILGSLIKKVSSPQGARDVFEEVQQFDTGLLDGAGRMLTGGSKQQQSSVWSSIGSKLISSLFGDKQGSIIGMIAKLSGIGEGSSKSLVTMLAPLLMGTIAKQVKSGNLGLSGLVDLVMGQKSQVAKSLPPEIGQQLGISSLLDQGADVVRESGARLDRAAQETTEAGAGLLKVLLPLAILVALGFGAWSLLRSEPAKEIAQQTSRVASDAAGTVADTADRITVRKPTIPSLDFDAINQRMGTSFEDLTESVSGITDVASARAAIPQFTKLQEQFQDDRFAKLPAKQMSLLGKTLSPMLEKLQSALEVAYRIPGVKAVLEPAVLGLTDRVSSFTKTG